MTILSGGADAPLNLVFVSYTSLFALAPIDHSPTGTTLGVGFGTVDVTGIDLGFDENGHLVSGTVTGFSAYTANGSLGYAFSGLSLDGAQIHAWVAAGDEQSFSHAMFAGNDTLNGTAFDDYLQGQDGHDVLIGGAGADVLFGGDGNDHLYGQSANGGPDGADQLNGGNGSDYLQGNAGDDILEGGAGSDRINGGADNDWISGGDGNDTVNGNMGNDTITGDNGNDFLRGGQGDDWIEGGSGQDTIMGDLGNDTINGGGGPDVMTGGAGADTFLLFGGDSTFPPSFTAQGGHQIITDFTAGVDHLSLLNGAAILYTVAPAADLAAAAAEAQTLFSGLSGVNDVAVAQVGTSTYLFWSSESSNFVDAAVELQHVHAGDILARDFVALQDVV